MHEHRANSLNHIERSKGRSIQLTRLENIFDVNRVRLVFCICKLAMHRCDLAFVWRGLVFKVS